MVKWTRAVPLVIVLLAGLTCLAVAQMPPVDPADAFFDDTVVHDIKLAINSRDWLLLRALFDENIYFPSDFRWRDQVLRNSSIRSRGTSSRSPLKPTLIVEFNRYTSGQQFVGLTRFILRNQWLDASNLHDRLSMLFFRRLGLVAPRETHARLYVNDEYVGLYTSVESVDQEFVQKNFGEKDGTLYQFSFDNGTLVAGANPPDEVIARFVERVNDTTGAAWRSAMAEFLDLEKFVRHLAIENFLAERNGITADYGSTSFNLYRFQNTNRFVFLASDKTSTFSDPNYPIFRNIADGPEDRRNRLVVRALQEPDLLQLYLSTLLECADSASSVAGAPPTGEASTQGWLEREVAREYDQIRAAAITDTRSDFTPDQFEEAIANLKAFARDRSVAVRAQVAMARGR